MKYLATVVKHVTIVVVGTALLGAFGLFAQTGSCPNNTPKSAKCPDGTAASCPAKDKDGKCSGTTTTVYDGPFDTESNTNTQALPDGQLHQCYATRNCVKSVLTGECGADLTSGNAPTKEGKVERPC